MAGRDGVSFPASSPDSAVATGTQQLKGSHFRSSVTELPNPAVAFRQPVSSCMLVSGLDAGVDSFNTFALGKTTMNFPSESEENEASVLPSAEEQLTVQHGLKCGSFMPFVNERRSREYKQPATQSKFAQFKVPETFPDQNQSHFVDLLCNRSFDDKQPNEWMKAVEHYLWGSDILPESDFKQEHIALCLKEAVWKVFSVREEDLPAQCALFWVLNRSFHDDVLPFTELGSAASYASTSFTSQAEFNIFSFRALFGAILHTDGKEAARVALHGFFPIHIAAENLFPDAVHYLLSWGVHVDQRTLFAGKTALHHAVRFEPNDDAERVRQKALLRVLNTFHASHNMQDVGGNVPLFNAILTEDVELIKLMVDYAPINHADADGDTHLHVAVEIHSDDIVRLLIAKGADPRIVNREGQTPSHLAAKNPLACLKAMKEECQKQHKEFISTFNHADALGNTPLDYAALHHQKDTFQYIWNCVQEDPSLSIAPYKVVLRRWIQKIRKPGVQTGLSNFQSTLKNIPKPAIQSIMTMMNVPGVDEQLSLYKVLQKRKEISVPAVTIILDKCVYGERAVIAQVLESDKLGCYPPQNRNEHSIVLRQMVKSLYSVWWHPALKIWVNSKWSHFGQWIMFLFFLLYMLQMVALTTALSLAARPGVTDETLNYYNTPLDQFRAFVEAVVILTWMVKIANELQKIIVLKPKIYVQDIFVYFNVSAIIFLLLTTILRASGSSSQWIFAALTYLTYSTLALEYLSLMKWSSNYVQTLFIILNRDLTKFLAIFIVFLIGFSGAFFLALQLDRPATSSGVSGGTDNSTLSIWNALYDGIRVMVEGQGVVNYNGNIGWFAVLLYLLFLMMTLIIMLNLLIAQMSDTYAKVQQNARAIATFSRARFMVRYLFILGHVHARRNGNECCRTIIWSDDSNLLDSGSGVLGRGAGLARSTAESLFSADRVALRDDEDDTSLSIKEKDTLTASDMQIMLGKVKKSLKNDLKGLRQEIRSLRTQTGSRTTATVVYAK